MGGFHDAHRRPPWRAGVRQARERHRHVDDAPSRRQVGRGVEQLGHAVPHATSRCNAARSAAAALATRRRRQLAKSWRSPNACADRGLWRSWHGEVHADRGPRPESARLRRRGRVVLCPHGGGPRVRGAAIARGARAPARAVLPDAHRERRSEPAARSLSRRLSRLPGGVAGAALGRARALVRARIRGNEYAGCRRVRPGRGPRSHRSVRHRAPPAQTTCRRCPARDRGRGHVGVHPGRHRGGRDDRGACEAGARAVRGRVGGAVAFGAAFMPSWTLAPNAKPVNPTSISRSALIGAVSCIALTTRAANAQSTRTTASRPFTVVEASIGDMRQALEQKRTTSHEIVQQYLTRIALYEDRINAIITVNPNALAIADSLDRERARGRIHGPLHGIPVALKDNIHTTSMPTTGGALAFADLVPPYE